MHWVLILGCIVILCIIIFTIFKHRRVQRIHLELTQTVTWDNLWNRANVLKRSSVLPVRFTLNGIRIRDVLVHNKEKIETIVRTSAEWATQTANIQVAPFHIQWRDGPTMEYQSSTLYISPDVIGRFTDADIVLASSHEIAGHHYQENVYPDNKRQQKEMCGMACERLLRSLSNPLVDRWILMRVVRGLIDLKINAPEKFPDKPTPEQIYDHFGTKMMTLDAIVSMVTDTPGVGLTYLMDEENVGKGCGCVKTN